MKIKSLLDDLIIRSKNKIGYLSNKFYVILIGWRHHS